MFGDRGGFEDTLERGFRVVVVFDSFGTDSFFVDEFYEATMVKGSAWCARAFDGLDRFVWNGVVWAFAYVVLGLSWLNRVLDEFVVNLGFDQGCNSMRLSGKGLSLWQNGQVQRYLRVIGLALVIFALIFIWGSRGEK